MAKKLVENSLKAQLNSLHMK